MHADGIRINTLSERRITGCAFRVPNKLGTRFSDKVYEMPWHIKCASQGFSSHFATNQGNKQAPENERLVS
jgi:hypothetical protein